MSKNPNDNSKNILRKYHNRGIKQLLGIDHSHGKDKTIIAKGHRITGKGFDFIIIDEFGPITENDLKYFEEKKDEPSS